MSTQVTRPRAVLLALAAAALLAASTRPVWLRATAADVTGTVHEIPVAGASAAPAVLALALVGLAAGLALLLTSRLVRVLTGTVLVLAGLGSAAAISGVLIDPAGAAASGVLEATSVMGREAEARTTVWPYLALLPAVLMAAPGALVLLRGRAWDRAAARFDRGRNPARAADPQEDPAAAWDALTSGEDPTDAPDEGSGAPR